MSTRAERRAVQEQQRNEKALRQLGDNACELVLVRHGETAWNIDHRLQGQLLPGPGLTERGRRQAEVLAERLRRVHFDCMYCSDLLRAVETAEVVVAARDSGTSGSTGTTVAAVAAAAVAAAAGVQADPRLRERFLGSLQGLTLAEAARQQPAAYAALSEQPSSLAPPPPGVPETLDQLEARAEAALEDLAMRHPGQRLLVITHGGFLHAVHKRASCGHVSGSNVNTAINTIWIEPQQPRCLWAVGRWGDAQHLVEAGALFSTFGGGTEGCGASILLN